MKYQSAIVFQALIQALDVSSHNLK